MFFAWAAIALFSISVNCADVFKNKPNKLAAISEKQPDNGAATVRFPLASPDAKEEDLVHIAADQYAGEIHCIAVSNNEKLLAYGGWGQSVTLLDVSTRKQ